MESMGDDSDDANSLAVGEDGSIDSGMDATVSDDEGSVKTGDESLDGRRDSVLADLFNDTTTTLFLDDEEEMNKMPTISMTKRNSNKSEFGVIYPKDHSSGGSEGRMDFSTVSDQADVGQSLTAFLPRTVLAEILSTIDSGEDPGEANNFVQDNTSDDCSRSTTDGSRSTISGIRPIYRRTGSQNLICNGTGSPFTTFSLGPRMWPESTGGMLMADVSGFTKFMAALQKGYQSRKGSVNESQTKSSGSHRTRHHDPAEQMSLILNNYFGAMVQTVEKHGGDVIKFAGDALICYWPIAGSTNRRLSAGGIAHYCDDESDMRSRMAQCALELVRDLNEYDTGYPNPDDGSQIFLSLHIACMVMQIKGLHIGGLNGRLEFLLAGPGFGKLGLLLDTAKNGEISIGKTMWDAFQTEIKSNCKPKEKTYANVPSILANSCAKEIIDKDTGLTAGYRIIDAHALLRQQNGNFLGETASATGLDIRTEWSSTKTKIDPSVYEAASSDPCIRAYVPSNVLHYHDHQQANLLSENRTVTVVFCSLPAGTCSSFDSAQNALLKIQKVLQRYNGLLRQFIEDDKATVVIGVWGCPPLSHQDDPIKAMDAALELRNKLGPCNIGVATGSCYCGAVGTPERCEYVVIGNAVNLSARMMGLGIKKMLAERSNASIDAEGDTSSQKAGTVICDETTRAAIFAYEERFAVVDQGEKEFKGVGKQTWNEIEHLDSGQIVQTMPICGRDEEQAILSESFNAALDPEEKDKPSPFIIAVHGPLGIGKSFLTSHFRREVRESKFDVEVVDCLCSEQEKNTPWFALQGLVPLLWKNVKFLPDESMKAIAFLEDISPDLTPAKYVDAVKVSRKVFVDNLVGETRLANILELLFTLISKQLERGKGKPLMIMVDDLQNCDANSLKFFDKYVDKCKEKPQSALLYIAVRPGAAKEIKEVLNKLNKVIKLKRLSAEAIKKLVKTELGVPLDAPCHVNFEDAVEKGSGGLPLFVSELCRFIRHRKLFVTDEELGLCLTEEGEVTFSKTSSSSPEEATQNAVRSIIDGLSPDARLLLKCSSLLPNQFRLSDVTMLSRTLTNHADEQTRNRKTKDAIDEIIANRLWERCEGAGSKKFRFSHGYMSETVYYSMTLAQRESLHQTYFALLESSVEEGNKNAGVNKVAIASSEWIASNAALASIHDKAALYYFKSAQVTHRSFSYVAANASLEHAFEHLEVHDGLDEEEEEPVIDITTRIQMTRLRGLMYCLLDRPLEGKPLLEKTLELAHEDGIFLPPTLLADGISVETERQHVHRQLKLNIGSANVFALRGLRTSDKDADNSEVTRKLILRECCAVYDQLARSYFQSGEPFRAIYCCLRGLNLAEMVGHCEELAKAYSTYAFVKKSAFYGNLARETAERVGGLAPVTGFCAMLYGGMLIGEGHFEASQVALKQAANVSNEVKDIATLGLSLSVLGWSMYVNGQYEDAFETATEMENIGKERNDPRFLNWGLTSHFRTLLALRKKDELEKILPDFKSYIEEYWGSMYNSDKISSVGMLIEMHLFYDDLQSVFDCVAKYESTVDLVMKPCTQLVEFGGCVGIIKGLIAVVGADRCCTNGVAPEIDESDLPEHDTNDEGNEKTKSKRDILTTALDSFDKYAETYPILNARANYLRGCAILAMDDPDAKEKAIDSFRLAISWSRRFNLMHEEDLVASHELANDIYSDHKPPIVKKEFDRQDAGTKGIDSESVIKKYETLIEQICEKECNDEKKEQGEEFEKWRNLVSSTCQYLLCLWGLGNSAINLAARELEQIIRHSESYEVAKDMNRDQLTILSFCMAEHAKMCKEQADS